MAGTDRAFHVVVTVISDDHSETMTVAGRLYGELSADGTEVLLDDRPLRPGVKFKDAELIGVPVGVTVGTRGLADGVVEVKDRATGETQRVDVEAAAGFISDLVRRSLVGLGLSRSPVPRI